MNLPEHIKDKINHVNGCWLWHGETDKYGYGRAWYRGFRYQAHRLIYWLSGVNGKFKIDNLKQEVDHICEVRNCVNPEHLQVLSRKKNMRKRWRKS